MAHVTPSTPPNETEIAPSSSRFSTPLYDPTGISSPTSDAVDATAWQVRGKTAPATDETAWLGRRGRRRRSSELAQSGTGQEEGKKGAETGAGDADHLSSNTLLWWQRPRHDGQESVTEHNSHPALPPLHHRLPPLHTAEAAEASSSPSPSLRSPAAEFLSSMNDMLGSPSSLSGSAHDSNRAYSLSPNRGTTYHLQGTSMPNPVSASLPRQYSHHGSEGSPFGIGSAAAHLYGATQSSQSHGSVHSVRPDDEGARIGPNGRYLLGATIGFGGFSSIREAWDLGPDGEMEAQQGKEGMHRVAVKIVYSSDEDIVENALAADEELKIWETIPSHPNLLPLLHHERISVDRMEGGTKHSSISFLVMPYCEGNLLTFVKSEGSLPHSSTVSPSNASLTRSISLQSTKEFAPQSDTAFHQPPSQRSHPRTGSGFIQRSSASSRVMSVPLASVLGHSVSLATPSTSMGTTSSMLRRASSRLSRRQSPTNGVAFKTARDVMKQLVDALLCLHSRSSVLHGDLKLENVLGQRSVSRYLRTLDQRDGSQDSETGADSDDSSPSTDALRTRQPSTTTDTICWRVADFGLAKRVTSNVDSSSTRSGWQGPIHVNRMSEPFQHGGSGEDRMARNKAKPVVGGVAGSLAYTAPETFLPSAVSNSEAESETAGCSPFAADMWALGCILYALCAGKLPFSDSFEPRLQMKIAKGKWEMPNRLKRCKERTRNPPPSAMSPSSNANIEERDRSRSGSFASKSRDNSLSASLKSKPHDVHAVGNGPVMDMSASMPALQERRFFAGHGGVRSASDTSIIVHDPEDSLDEVQEEEVENTESDGDEQIDQEVDGRSAERVGIRRALRKLLEPDPRKRWTIEQFASLPWISGANPAPFSVLERDEDRLQVLDGAGDLPSSLEDVLISSRPSLVHSIISEHASQEMVTTREGDISRGRTKRRADMEDEPARPINIDRSSSRSRSRPGLGRMESSPWNLGSSFEKSLQQTVQRDCRRGAPSGQGQRSSSADGHAFGERSTSSGPHRSASRPPRLELARPALPRAARHESPALSRPSTRGSNDSVSRSSTSRSRSRARDALHDIVYRDERRDGGAAPKQDGEGGGEERLWWQRGRKSGR